MGRKSHIVTEENRAVVHALAKANKTHEYIAQEIGISSDTLVKYYKKELNNGRSRTKAIIINALMDKVKQGDTTAIIFACKTILGMQEKQNIEHSFEKQIPNIQVKFGK